MGLTKKGKGTKLMVLVGGSGIPLAGLVASAQESEYNLALPTVDGVSVPTRPQHDKKRPKELTADRGYDAKWLRKALRKRGITPYIPKRKKPGSSEEPTYNTTIKPKYRKRWVVERTFAWLGWNRRLTVRWDRYQTMYQAFFNVACLMICLREVLK